MGKSLHENLAYPLTRRMVTKPLVVHQSSNAAWITLLISGTILATSGFNAYACSNPITGAETDCSFGDVDVTVTSTGNVQTSSTLDALDVGENNLYSHALVNNGQIAASGTDAVVHGIGIYGDIANTGSIINNGSVSAVSSGENFEPFAYGIYSDGGVYGTIINNGSLTASSSSVSQRAIAVGVNMGLYTDGFIYAGGSIINSKGGIITATATGTDGGALAYGLDVSVEVAGHLVNEGVINASSQSQQEETNAIGMFAGEVTGFVSNSGIINATAISSVNSAAVGMFANHVTGTGSLTNTGTINVSAIGTDYTLAVGMFADMIDAGGVFSNSGTIRASGGPGANAYAFVATNGSGIVVNSGMASGNMLLGGTVGLDNSGTILLPSSANGYFKAQVGGNYVQGGSGLLGFGVLHDTTYSSMVVSGTADFTGSNKLRVTLEPGNDYTGATLTGVVSAGTLTGPATYSILDNSLAYSFTGVKDGNAIDIHATPTGLTTVSNAVRVTGLTSGGGVATTLDSFLTNGAPSGFEGAIASINNATGNQQIANVASQLTPLMAGGAQRMLMDNMHITNQIIEERLDATRGMASGDTFTADRNIWLKPFGSWADQSDRNGVSGYDGSTAGVALGGDGVLAATDTRLGVALVYSHTNVSSNSDAAPQNDQIDSYQGIIYGSQPVMANTDVNFQADIGNNSNEGERYISFMNELASAGYNSWSGHAGIGIEHTYQWGNTLVAPSLRTDYAYIRSAGYSESGAGALDLNVNGNTTQELIFAAGGKLQQPLCTYVSLVANAGIGYDAINDRASLTSDFAGGGPVFATQGISQSPWIGRAGLGLMVNQFYNVEITARYDLEARSDFTDQTASLKLRLPF